MRVLSQVIALLSLLLAAGPALAAGKSVVLVKTDGSRVHGELLEQSERGFLINGESGLFLVPFADVKHVEYRDGTSKSPAVVETAEEVEGDWADEPVDTAPEEASAAEDAPPPEDAPPEETPPEETPPADDTAPSDAPAVDGTKDSAAGSWAVVQKNDGTTVSGTLVEQDADRIVIRSGTTTVTVSMDEVDRVVSGDLGGSDDAAEPPPQQTSTSAVPPPPARRPRDPMAVARASEEFEQYTQERLQLVDRRGYWLGPRKLGYPGVMLRADNRVRFHAVVAGSPDYRLTFSEFLDLTGDDRLRARHERAVSLATAQGDVGVVMMIVGGGLMAASGVSMAIAGGGLDSGAGFSIGAPLLLAGVPHLAIGATLAAQASRTKQELAGYDLEVLLQRDRAFNAVQKYNAHLRTRYGLPENQRLDAPAEQ